MPSESRVKRLQGKVAVITGASRGIGRETALLFAEEGAQVILTARDVGRLEAVAGEAEGRTGLRPDLYALDVKNAQNVDEISDKILDKYKRVDILVNNAGVTKDGLLVRMSEADWDDVLDTNLKGAFLCIRAFSRAMMKQRSGKIINMASVIGLTGNAGQANYAASKAGLIALTRSIAKELGSRNILVNAVAPGFIDTEMTRGLSEEIKSTILKSIPAARFGSPMDVAKVVLFLASDECHYMTGQVVTVDGGLVMA